MSDSKPTTGVHGWSGTGGRRATVGVAAVVALAVLGAASVPAAAQTAAEASFDVQLRDDGSARVAVTMTFDLDTDDERAAFRTLQNDSDARATTRDRFERRMASVASAASDATGRDMTVDDAAIDLATSDDGSVGVVELSVAWTNLAATTDDGRLVVTEPFASDFTTDRPFTLRGPPGYRLASAAPSPAGTADGAATWSARSDLSGFEVVFEPTGDGGTETTAVDGTPADDETPAGDGGFDVPGFGVGAALVALLAGLALVRRR